MACVKDGIKMIWQGVKTSFTSSLSARPLRLLHVDIGGCGGCTMELQCVNNYPYNTDQGGFSFTSDPACADALLLTGTVCREMVGYISDIWSKMPEPKGIITVGDCTTSSDLFIKNYAVMGDVEDLTSVDLAIAGCPPTPQEIVVGLKSLLQKLPA